MRTDPNPERTLVMSLLTTIVTGIVALSLGFVFGANWKSAQMDEICHGICEKQGWDEGRATSSSCTCSKTTIREM